jgi:transposase
MNNVSLFGGVDYHQDQVQVCLLDDSGRQVVNRSMANDVDAVARLLQQAGEVQGIAIEACCGAAAFGEQLAARGSWRVELAHPGYVARLKQSPDKSDYSDGRLLADLTRVGYLPRVWLAPPAVRDLRQLAHHRQRLVDRRRALKLQVGAVLREQRVKLEGSRWSKCWIARATDHARLSSAARWIVNDLLEEIAHAGAKIQNVERKLREACCGNELIEKLRTIEGVGEVTAWMLAAWIGRFDRFKNGKQLSRYCGLSPRNASSGSRQADAGLISAANPALRAVLIQAAHRLMRTSERWSGLANRLLKKGKPKCVVVAAVANRWVRSMHHQLVDQTSVDRT